MAKTKKSVSRKLSADNYKLVLPRRGTRRYDETLGSQTLGSAAPEEQGEETINSIAREMYAIAEQHGFHEKHVKGQIPSDFGAWCMNLVGEVAELWEAYRNDQLDKPCDKKCKLGSQTLSCAEEELADIQIRLMDTAEQLGVNLGRAVARKAAYNRTRPYRHGGKKA